MNATDERDLALRARWHGAAGQERTMETTGTVLFMPDAAAAADFFARVLGRAPGRPTELLSVETPDVPGACAQATAAGATLVNAPRATPWGQTVAYLRAPGGTLVELATPMN